MPAVMAATFWVGLVWKRGLPGQNVRVQILTQQDQHMNSQRSAFGKRGDSSIYGNPYIPSKAERSPGEDSVSKLVATEGCITEECIIRLQVRLIQH